MEKTVTKHYLQFVTMTEDPNTGARTYKTLDGRLEIVASCCTHNLKNKKDLMNIWKKHGCISEKFTTHIGIMTYFTDCNNNCYGWYNITHKRSEDGKRTEVNFDYLKEWNEENVEELVAECVRLREMDIRY